MSTSKVIQNVPFFMKQAQINWNLIFSRFVVVVVFVVVFKDWNGQRIVMLLQLGTTCIKKIMHNF